ncbi:MAG: hypothetical protein IJM63_11945 [Solobacterium sp.]|nr:hypothetical protein [Solobacterium sp.]
MFKSMIASAAIFALLAGSSTMYNPADKHADCDWGAVEETEITPEVQEIFDEATASLIGVDYEAVELIETQNVNGTNYRIEAESRVVRPGAEKKTVIITIHKGMDGTVTLREIEG